MSNAGSDASVVWSFHAIPADATVQGDVQFDAAKGTAEFRGGWLEMRIPDPGSLARMTFHMRVRIPSGGWSVPLFSICDDNQKTALEVTGRRVGASSSLSDFDSLQHYSEFPGPNARTLALEAELGLQGLEDCIAAQEQQYEEYRLRNPGLPPFVPSPDLADGRLRVGAPVQIIGAEDWHGVTVRFTGPNLELFVDGVLVDEEWAAGMMRPGRVCRIGAAIRDGAPVGGLHGFVEGVSLWNRALSNKELQSLNGGEKAVGARELEILGPDQPSLQYWKPRGHNAFAGDTSCFFDGRRWHLFYLFDRRHHHSKWRAGAHQFAHASSEDLIHWTHHPLAIAIDEQWLTCGTANCILRNGRYHFFYGMHTERLVPASKTVRPDMLSCLDANGRFDPIPFDLNKAAPAGLACATSDDGIVFEKERLTIHADENGFIFHDPESGLYQMLAARARYTSTDLRSWTLADPHFLPMFDDSAAKNTDECPCYFEWNGWHYILMGKTGFWMSRRALGPYWNASGAITDIATPRWDIYDGTVVPMVAPFHGNRMILSGWLAEKNSFGTMQFGGHLIFREFIQHEDGTLGMKWPEEMIPASGPAIDLPIVSLGESVKAGERRIHIESGRGFEYGALSGVPERARITMQVCPGQDAKSFGVCVKGAGEYRSGCELRFEPGRRRVQWGRPVNGKPSAESTAAAYSGGDFAIENVEGIDRPFSLDIIIRDEIIDACIGGNRTMVIRRKRLHGARVFFFTAGGAISFNDVCVRPLE